MKSNTTSQGTIRLGGSAVLAAALAVLTALSIAAPANATAYRFWSYWQGATGQWVAADSGAGQHQIVDEDVQGWRFGISADTPTLAPDNEPTFAALCPELAAAEAPADGSLRVAVVIDSGLQAHAPSGQTTPPDRISCVSVPAGATGNQALAAAAQVRDEGGMVCAIGGFPAAECSAEVSEATLQEAVAAAATEPANPASPVAAGADTESPTPSGSPLPLIVALLLAFGVAGLALVTRRRNEARGPARSDS